MKIIKQVAFPPKPPKKKKVAAYCRVSTAKEEQEHSLSAQISYYNTYIAGHPDWELARIYADNGISGTQAANRQQFQQMLEDCKKGLVDIIITKSVSRFARNTVDLLKTIRQLKALNIDVFFEKENLHTISKDGEVLLTLLATFAQAESVSLSDNIKWRLRKNYENGIFPVHKVFGYDVVNKQLVVNENEAAVVRRIFDEYIAGKSMFQIASDIRSMPGTYPIPTTQLPGLVRRTLAQEKSCGDTLLQKWYIDDPVTHKQKRNTGEKTMFYVPDSHQGIVSQRTFEAAKDILSYEALLKVQTRRTTVNRFLAGRIKCGYCGETYTGQHRKKGYGYLCHSRAHGGRHSCISPTIDETDIISGACSVLEMKDFNERTFMELIDWVIVNKENRLDFVFKDGRTVEYVIPDKEDTEDKARFILEQGGVVGKIENFNCFTGRLFCENCGKMLDSTTRKGARIWRCQKCALIVEDELLRCVFAKILQMEYFDEKLFTESVDRVSIGADKKIHIADYVYDFTKDFEKYRADRKFKDSPYELSGLLVARDDHIHLSPHKGARGLKWIYYRKDSPLGSFRVDDEETKRLISDSLGLPKFDIDKVKSLIYYAEVDGKNMWLHMQNGEIYEY